MLMEFALRHLLLATSSEGTLRVTDLATNQTLWTQTAQGKITKLAFSPDGQLLASACSDGVVRLWQARLGIPWCSFPVDHPVRLLRWSETQRLACAGTQQITTWIIPQAIV